MQKNKEAAGKTFCSKKRDGIPVNILFTNAEQLFSSFGITITDAISIFLHKSIMERELPIEIKQPRFNVKTEAVRGLRNVEQVIFTKPLCTLCALCG